MIDCVRSVRWIGRGTISLCLGSMLLFGASSARSQPVSCSILSSCAGIKSLPTAAQCESDDCSCAQQVECYLRHKNPAENWPLIPGGKVALNKNFFHDRFIKTQISPEALKYWKRFSDPSIGPVAMPDGTVVYKSGFLPKDTNLAKPDKLALSSYVFVKIRGYCPNGSTIGNICLGGDWFGMEVTNATYGILSPGDIDNAGKSTRCFACHAAAEKADWLWQLFSRRRYP